MTSPKSIEQPECKAYKPWIRTTNRDGSTQKACLECTHFGRCEWTWEPEEGRVYGLDADEEHYAGVR